MYNLFCITTGYFDFSALVHFHHSCVWRCWFGGRKGIRPVLNWVVGCWDGYKSGSRWALHMAQLMPLPLPISCSSKSRLVFLPGFTFVVPAHLRACSSIAVQNKFSSTLLLFTCTFSWSCTHVLCRIKDRESEYGEKCGEYERQIKHLRVLLREKDDASNLLEIEKKYWHLYFYHPL